MKANILIVDDSGMSRRSMRQILEGGGYTVEEATDGATALERYFLNHHDLVVLDLVMEGMYGMDVLAKLRELNPDIRVIIATADIQKSTRSFAADAGARALINKPFNRDEILKVVSEVLEGAASWN